MRRPLLAALAAVVVLALLGPGAGLLHGPTGVPPGALRPSAQLPTPDGATAVNLTLDPATEVLNQSFWGTTVSARSPFFANESALINATPARVALWPGAFAADDYDPFNNTLFDSASSLSTAPTSEVQFVDWCRSVGCTAIFELPGEINNATFAAEVVNYTENTLDFHPAFWEIGNEPALWRYWSNSGSMWWDWTNSTSPPDPTQYAWEEHNYTIAIREVDPHFSFIGLPGVGPTFPYTLYQWVNATVYLDGTNMSGLASHVYPDLSGADDSLSTFYGYLNGSNSQSIPARVPNLERYVREAESYSPSCRASGCHLPLMFTELGSAISSRQDATHYSEQFAGGLFMAAEVVQTFEANITTVEAYASVLDTANSWYTISGDPHPLYTFYSDFFARLGPDVHFVRVSSPDPSVSGNVFAAATVAPSDADREDLMVVNTNVATNVSFTPTLPGYAAGTPVEAWLWNGTPIPGFNGPSVAPATPAPTALYFPDGLPANWTLPDQSIALFESRPAGGVPVRFVETGLPDPTRWFVGVGNVTETSNTSTLTFFLTPGAYATVPGPAIGVYGHVRIERWAPAPATPFTLGSAPLTLAVPFTLQYALNLTVTPSGVGSIGATTQWADANATVRLTAVAEPGYAFASWYGWGPGSVNGSSNPTTVSVLGPLHERAIFVPGYAVSFDEEGLPAGTPWSVTVRATPLSGSGPLLSLGEPNGTFGYRVTPVPGYHLANGSGSVDVTGSSVSVQVRFFANGFPYPVTVAETGLPEGTAWTVDVRGTAFFGSGATLRFVEPNGTYGFSVEPVAGFREVPSSSFFEVAGGPVTVTVQFLPTPSDYAVTWLESGLPSGANWSISVRGASYFSTGPSLTVVEPNGTYTYYLGNLSGYRASPPEGGVTVAGTAVTLSVSWYSVPVVVDYPLTFEATGLGPGAEWTVNVAGQAATSSGSSLTFAVSNGTWHFGVEAPSGHFAVPGGGTVVVAGRPVTVTISLGGLAPPTTNGPLLPAGPSDTDEVALVRALAVVGMIAVVAVPTYFLLTRRVRRPAPPPAVAPVRPRADYLEDEDPAPSGVDSDYHEDTLSR